MLWSREARTVTVIAKNLPRMGFGYLGPSERGQGFFSGFSSGKKGWPFDTWMKRKGGAEKNVKPGIMTHVFGPTTMKNWVESSESSESFESAKMIFKSPTKKCSVFQNFQVCRRLHLFFFVATWPPSSAQDRHNLSLCVLFSQRANAIRDKVGQVRRSLPKIWGMDTPKNDGPWNMAIFSIYLQFLGVGLTHSNQI